MTSVLREDRVLARVQLRLVRHAPVIHVHIVLDVEVRISRKVPVQRRHGERLSAGESRNRYPRRPHACSGAVETCDRIPRQAGPRKGRNAKQDQVLNEETPCSRLSSCNGPKPFCKNAETQYSTYQDELFTKA